MFCKPLAIRREEAGFTLVELAVVMIIIGLLIGGVLKGQELITNAQVTSAVSQMKGMDAAITTFRDSYAAMPGDMAAAATRLPNCATCTGGDGNNRINQAPGAAPTGTNENAQVWSHLSAADLVSGVAVNGGLSFGDGLPEASIGGGYFIGYHVNGTSPAGAVADPRSGHYLALTGDATAAVGAATSAVLTSSQAARIDRKIDDGAPDTGSMIAATITGGACTTGSGTAVVYNEQTDPMDCALYYRIQQ